MTEATVRRNWREILLNRKMVICILQGIASGLPLYVLIQLVPAWLRTSGVDLGTIGLFALVGIPYTYKFLWSPFLDRFQPGFFGRRRGWMLVSQVLVMAAIGSAGFFDPEMSLEVIVWLTAAVAFFSATQDIVLDAYRRELLAEDELGTGNSLFVNAYRLSSLIPGSLALILSDLIPWSQVFMVTAAFMGIGIATTLWIKETDGTAKAPASIKEAVIEPFKEFFGRNGVKPALAVLAFMFLYKIGDSMATALSTPFYLDLGFSATEIGTIAKAAGLWASAAGTLLGGLLMLKMTINRALWCFGFVQIVSILGFAVLAEVGNNPMLLFAVVSFEYLGVGLGSVALIAYMARQTSLAFSATQYALFASLTALPRTFANATTGFLIEAYGYTHFFLLCTAIAVPGMLLLFWVAPWNGEDRKAAD
ncbi:MAG: AmpG family muropeptide MFS transporter [Lysobacteraceae bacterium]|nr:MAG: AmpG family muropeptide MFS transporter [Xanthomonadaceae bacterium]